MLLCVTPLTLELIEFILKQQILLKHDLWNVILNQVALQSLFHFRSLCHCIPSFLYFFLSDPNFSAVSGLPMVLNQHITIVVVWEKKHSLVAVLQISRLKACHSWVIYYTDLDTHSLVRIVFYSLDRVFCCSQLSRNGESLDIHNLMVLVCFKCPTTSEPSQHRGLLVQIS